MKLRDLVEFPQVCGTLVPGDRVKVRGKVNHAGKEGVVVKISSANQFALIKLDGSSTEETFDCLNLVKV